LLYSYFAINWGNWLLRHFFFIRFCNTEYINQTELTGFYILLMPNTSKNTTVLRYDTKPVFSQFYIGVNPGPAKLQILVQDQNIHYERDFANVNEKPQNTL
jgi:hypothetical protein